MSFALPKIYPITDCPLTKLTHLEQVKQLLNGGAKIIQLREKSASPNKFYIEAKEVMDFIGDSDVKIIINDRVDIALAVKAHGVHLGQDDLPPINARQILGNNFVIGFSTHNIEQAIAATQLPIDYLAFGPVFSTKTKENPDPVVGLNELKNLRQSVSNFPIVAIGGISIQNVSQVINSGADSAAIISGILVPANQISDNIKQLIKLF